MTHLCTSVQSHRWLSLWRCCGLVLLMCLPALSQAAEPVSKSRLGGVAIGGHDAAAYHSLAQEPQDPAVEGARQFTVEYKGAKWRFADAQSAARFEADPEAFAPAYNGHCANALSLGEGLVRTDGTHWQILNDQLYLFYAGRGRDRWIEGDWQAYKLEADAAWQKLGR